MARKENYLSGGNKEHYDSGIPNGQLSQILTGTLRSLLSYACQKYSYQGNHTDRLLRLIYGEIDNCQIPLEDDQSPPSEDQPRQFEIHRSIQDLIPLKTIEDLNELKTNLRRRC